MYATGTCVLYLLQLLVRRGDDHMELAAPSKDLLGVDKLSRAHQLEVLVSDDRRVQFTLS
jgi:hypothetical protein